MKVLQLVILEILYQAGSASIATDYYKSLINEVNDNAAKFTFPQTNSEFEGGINSNITEVLGDFDFIIVGAGSAGATLATRLSENADFNILLLEAGGEERAIAKIPAYLYHLEKTELNWGYFSTKQEKSCLAMTVSKCICPRGKSLGGSSSINAMVYTRGNPKDYDTWEEMGNPGWSYKQVLPYFKKSENSQINSSNKYRGTGGFWNIEHAMPESPLLAKFLGACNDLDLPTLDFNAGTQIGAGQMQFSTKMGRRQSTATAFLQNARKRRNLRVITNALVTKILFDNNIATGVEIVTKSQKFIANAKKEVILSGGAVNSPQLLMLSGIGPTDHLERLNIKPLVDLPVGENLIEHPMFLGLEFDSNYTVPDETLDSALNKYIKGYGDLTKAIVMEGISFKNVDDELSKVPNIEYVFIAPGGEKSLLIPLMNFKNEIQSFLAKSNPLRSILLPVILLHPKSRGSVTLKSKNPLDFPNIDLNLLESDEDMETLIKGIKFGLKIMTNKAFQGINIRNVDYPICEDKPKDSKEFWKCFVAHFTTTVYHLSGTTRMGPDNRTSVVNHELKVHGLKNLRVVDAGIFPSSISGHTNAPTVMVAEKIADVIKDSYKNICEP